METPIEHPTPAHARLDGVVIQATLLLFTPQPELELDPILDGLEEPVRCFLHCYVVFQ